MPTKELKGTKDDGRVEVLRAGLYHSHQIIVRRIGKEYFEYLLEYNGQIYSSYIIITPQKGKRKLTEDQVNQCRDLIWAGAEATLDELLGIDTVDEKTREYVSELIRRNNS